MKSRDIKRTEWELTRARFHIADRYPPRPLKKEKTIDSILTDILKEEEKQSTPDLPEELMNRWPLIAGKQIAKHTSPAFLKQETLIVHTDHPGWLQEVRRLPQQHFIKKLAAIPALPPISKITFKLDPDARTWKNKNASG